MAKKEFYAIVKNEDDSTEASVLKVLPLRTQNRADFEEHWEELTAKASKTLSQLCCDMEKKGYEIEIVDESPATVGFTVNDELAEEEEDEELDEDDMPDGDDDDGDN